MIPVFALLTSTAILFLICAVDNESKTRKKEIDRIWTALFNDTYLQKRKQQQQRVCSHCGGKR